MKFEQGRKTALFLPNGMVVYGKVVVSHPDRVVLAEGGFTGVESLRGALTGEQVLPLDSVPGEFQVAKGVIVAAFDAELVRTVEGD